MFGPLLDILFPPRCFGCGDHLLADERAQYCCASCAHTVHTVGDIGCPICAMPREVQTGVASPCSACLERPQHLAHTHAVWTYDGAVADALRRSKSSNDPSAMFALVDAASDVLNPLGQQYRDWRWTTPPIHPDDLRRRGWDPARAACRRAFVARCEDPLHRPQRRRVKQARLGKDAREASLRGAFEAVGPAPGRWVVFDDVMTTGATLREAARALRAAGASEVIAIALCRST